MGLLFRSPSKKDDSYLCMWMKKMAEKKQNLDPMWKVPKKEVDLGEPTSFLDHVYLRCTPRQFELSKDVVDNSITLFESRLSAVRTANFQILRFFCISPWFL